MKYLLVIVSLLFSSTVMGEEINKKYKDILFNYAHTALLEFDHVESSKLAAGITLDKATFAVGKDEIGRTFYVVLFPDNGASIYVSMLLNKDGYLEIHGRGSISVSPKDFSKHFKKYIRHVVYYPGAA